MKLFPSLFLFVTVSSMSLAQTHHDRHWWGRSAPTTNTAGASPSKPMSGTSPTAGVSGNSTATAPSSADASLTPSVSADQSLTAPVSANPSLTNPGSSGSQSPTPPVSGYHLAFSDDFDGLNLSPTGYGAFTWYPGIWWNASLPLPSLITANNSVLNLAWSRNGGGLSNTSISTIAKDGSQGRTFRYGYFEARMKWDVINGSWPAFWLIPKQAINGEQHTGEIDIFEGQGSDPRIFNGTLHEWQGGNNIWTSSPNWYLLPEGNDFSQWHTYAILWEPGTVSWYYDGQKLFSFNTPPIFDQQDYFLVIGSGVGTQWIEGNLQGVTANTINLDIDWVRVWQR